MSLCRKVAHIRINLYFILKKEQWKKLQFVHSGSSYLENSPDQSNQQSAEWTSKTHFENAILLPTVRRERAVGFR